MISLNWVKDYIDLSGVDLKDLAVKITKAGINVENVQTNHIDNLVIGNVIECINHPDSDHLHVCKVDIGTQVLQIVCGAPNVREGLKVIVSLIGAKLPGNFEIKKSTIRGVDSYGMLCSLSELGLEEKNEENYAKGIYELPSDANVGGDPLEYLGIDDTLYELDVHKHRNNDCYYHIGFAYEIACILNKKVKLPEDSYNVSTDNVQNYINLKVETDKCNYYLGKMVKNIKIGPSPEFIKKRLQSVGMRSINNVVDISNYVMLEYGQPLHFFDKDKLGNNIVVRNANTGEKIITLDEKERVLTDDDIVITDGNKPVAIAGVMGGFDTEIDDNTKNVFIESAIFDPVSIRNTASRLDLKSEASIRYGKGLNFEYTLAAINRACHLLQKYAGAEILDGTIKYDTLLKEPKVVSFKADDVNKMLGITISNDDIEKELNRLDFKYELSNDIFKVTIPFRRLDIDSNVNDIAEEIGRLYGYHNLVSSMPFSSYKKGGYIGDVKIRKEVSKRLRNLGLNETRTYTLVSEEMTKKFNYEKLNQIKLPNPMSKDKEYVRTTLIPSLLSIYDYNKARKVNDVLIYEISKVYDASYKEDIKISILMKGNYIYNNWQHNEIKVDFYVIKGIVENLLEYLGFRNRYSFVKKELPDMHLGMCASILLDNAEIGIIGRVHPLVNKDDIFVAELSLKELSKDVKPLKYKEASKYPEIEKDVAFIVDNDMSSETILKEIKKAGGKLLKGINVFDLYIGNNIDEGKKSLAFKLVFYDNERTLTEKEVMDVFNNIIDKVVTNLGAVLRN